MITDIQTSHNQNIQDVLFLLFLSPNVSYNVLLQEVWHEV